jgi:transposase-like protein
MSENKFAPSHERTFTSEQRAKLISLVNDGIEVEKEIEALSDGLKDTVESIAKELEIKPSILKKAIKTARKGKFTETNEDHLTLENILVTVGRTL